MTRVLAGPRRRTSLVILAAVAMLLTALVPPSVDGSSHREAPLISEDPTADNTDLYAWRTDGNTVTIVANFIPLEEPAGGPNFSNFSENVLYEIKVDNTGDARPDVTYQFRFDTKIADSDLFGESFLFNDFPLETTGDPDQLLTQTYTVTRVAGSGGGDDDDDDDRGADGRVGRAPCRRRTSARARRPTTRRSARARSPSSANGGTAFAGPRDDAFFVDLGSIFDLGGLRPFNGAHLIPLAERGRRRRGGRLQHPHDLDPGPDHRSHRHRHGARVREPGRGHRHLGDGQPAEDDRPARRDRSRFRRLGPGLEARQPADQRGHHSGGQEGPYGMPRSRATMASSSSTTRSRRSRGSPTPSTSRSSTRARRTVPTWWPSCSPG